MKGPLGNSYNCHGFAAAVNIGNVTTSILFTGLIAFVYDLHFESAAFAYNFLSFLHFIACYSHFESPLNSVGYINLNCVGYIEIGV